MACGKSFDWEGGCFGGARKRRFFLERVSSWGKRLRRVRFPLPVVRRIRRVVFWKMFLSWTSSSEVIKTEFEVRQVLACKEVFQVWSMFNIFFILLLDIHEFLVWCLNVFVGFFSLFFLYLGLLAFASCPIRNWFYIPCFGVSCEISVFPPLFSF